MTQRSTAASAALILAALAGCATTGNAPVSRIAGGTFRTAAGVPAGTAQVIASGETVTLKIAVAGMPAGIHGLHLHAVGKCDAPGFTSAGPHLNPAGHRHGTDNPAGSHLGDLPNLVVSGSGTGALTAMVRGSRAELESQLFDGDGTAVVIHADPDDYRTDPSGNSGTRIACAVLTRG